MPALGHCRSVAATPAPTGRRVQHSSLSLRSRPGHSTYGLTWAPGQPHGTGDAVTCGETQAAGGAGDPDDTGLIPGDSESVGHWSKGRVSVCTKLPG